MSCAPSDEDPRVGRDRRHRGAAAVEDDEIGLERGGELRAFEDVVGERRARQARRPRGGSRPSARRRAPPSRDGRTPRGARRARARRARRRVGGVSTQLRLGRPAAPHRDDDDATVAREQRGRRARSPPSCRRACPCRSPRATERRHGSNDGGSKRKSAPTYGSPSASAPRRPEHPLARAEHRLVGEVDDDRPPPPRRARRRAARRSRRRRAASPCRRRAAPPTTSYGSSASASRTTGA